MNRNLLLIAIAAVTVVGIAAGMLLLGNGQPGSLSGTMGPAPTNLTLNVSTCSAPDRAGNVTYTLSGYLRDANGISVAGKTITLYWLSCSNGACATNPPKDSGVTADDGSFSFVKNEPPTRTYNANTSFLQYYARFAGDEQYAGSTSSTVKKLC